MNVPGLAAMVAFYLLVLGIGIWASVRAKRARERTQENRTEYTLLGNRGISLAVGVFTMTATFVGGGFITGLTEAVYTPTMGLTWAVMPVTGALSFIVGGLFFAKKMRERKYVTMMDPFQHKYGKTISGILSVALLISDIIWVTGTLIGLGSTMSIILDVPYSVCIWLSAAVAIIYTLLGGLYSVAYTDIIQLILIFCSLWLCVPFVLMSPYTEEITKTAHTFIYQAPWSGSINKQNVWIWIDNFLLLCLGNLGYQDFHQRTLSSSSSSTARITCFIAAPMIFVLGIPPVLIGAAAVSTNWTMTDYGSPSPYERGEAGLVLPIALQYLTPSFISIVGIGAIAAAVMSSTDSALLSAASIFTSNIYKNILRTKAPETELQWIIRITVVLLVCILFCEVSNGYGCIMGVVTVLLLKVLSGEPALGLSPLFYYPGCPIVNGTYVQCAPVQTICMFCGCIATLMFSCIAHTLFSKKVIPGEWDVFSVTKYKAPHYKIDTNLNNEK
ncbi:high affinity choline transporter 1-like isoform X2 [Periophthalmus magnuspinnatus]|uniref:high affinity choline transporter 1-like isoform X2 n=1 Tax=Periophthalmus magnuspinnatus TaxID=409849 RepID=UPI0024373904|nr:high affinity choline transporter 1-like isoform X2 [Periophthalmus magnuspinnatus]XP_055080958.1 high affinity choline transporter 1-like isoform X2 [Periophthalmus magnuspinnatus]